jgi:1-acyl-sn-glycerol-3-phosphate acyltransferase
MVAILGNHTSNWDAIWSVILKYVIEDRPIGWVMKDNAFRFPFRAVLLWLGCIPVKRHAPEGFVEQVSRKFMAGKFAAISITPEGTRRKVDRWKTGFYRIAVECGGIPIVPTFIDYKRKVMGVGPALWPSGDYDADMRVLAKFYGGVAARHPEFASEAR